jgi:putative lipoprotein (rSAM/lipoprotein system)
MLFNIFGRIMAIISKTYSRILAFLLSCLGFPAILISCAKYGDLMATYKAKGVVVSETDGAPIEGIRAVLKQPIGDNRFYRVDSIYTDSKGVFNLQTYEGYHKIYVELADIDGEKNGSFNDKDVEVDFSHVKFKGNSDKHREVEKDLGIIKMTPKE